MDELEQSAELPNSDAAHDAAAEDHNDAELNDGLSPDPDSQEQTEEEDEIEVDGKKFVMPKSAADKLKAERLMHADYTRKTQEVAKDRETVATEREQNRQQAEQQQKYLDDMAEMRAIDKQLKQYNEMDWNQAIENDPVYAMQLQQQQRALEAQRSQVAQTIAQKQNEHALNEQQATAKQLQEAEAYVQREITGWTPERGSVVNAYATAEGMKMDQAFAKLIIQQPALLKIMDKAEKFDQLVKKQAMKPKAPTAPPAPVTRVSAGRATAAKDPAKMTDAEYFKHREEQRRKR